MLESSGGLTELDVQDGLLPELAAEAGCQPGAQRGLPTRVPACVLSLWPGLLQHGSTLRLNGRCQTPYSVALELREHHSHHILLSRKPSPDVNTEECGSRGQKDSSLESIYHRID